MENKVKILYAEDEEIVAKSMMRMLSMIADIDYVKDGAQAYELYLKNNEYDILITDVKMPNMNGIELIKKIKSNTTSHIPFIIITTAYNDTDFLLEGIELKIDKFLLKPIKLNRLFDYIEEYKEITQQKLKLKEQKRMFNSYKEIVDQQNLICICDTKGTITFVNENFCRVSGYTKEELIGQNNNIVQHPNTPRTYYKELWSTIQNKKVFKTTFENLSKKSKSFYLRGLIAPFLDKDGEIAEYISISEDATKEVLQNKEIESLRKKEQLRDIQKATKIQSHNLLEYIPLPAFIVKDSKIIDKNELFEEIFLIDPMDDFQILKKIFNTKNDSNILKDPACISSIFEVGMDIYNVSHKQLINNEVLIIVSS